MRLHEIAHQCKWAGAAAVVTVQHCNSAPVDHGHHQLLVQPPYHLLILVMAFEQCILCWRCCVEALHPHHQATQHTPSTPSSMPPPCKHRPLHPSCVHPPQHTSYVHPPGHPPPSTALHPPLRTLHCTHPCMHAPLHPDCLHTPLHPPLRNSTH